MKLLVFGGRDYRDRVTQFAAMDHLHARFRLTRILHGGASGADQSAHVWAVLRNVTPRVVQAAWDDLDAPGAVIAINKRGKPYNKMAGMDRNQRMADMKPDRGLQFPGGPGTADMRRRLDIAGIPVFQVYALPLEQHDIERMRHVFIKMGEARGFVLRPHAELKELDMVLITKGAWAGQIGTIVHVHADGAAYAVELADAAERLGAITIRAGSLEQIGERSGAAGGIRTLNGTDF